MQENIQDNLYLHFRSYHIENNKDSQKQKEEEKSSFSFLDRQAGKISSTIIVWVLFAISQPSQSRERRWR